MANAVEDAIAAATSPQALAPRFQGQITLPSSGRVIGLDVPADVTPLEVLELVGFLSNQLPAEIIRASGQPLSRILVPR